MIVGIVGHEAAKFTPRTEAFARSAIRQLLIHNQASAVCSGHCHLGGIDIWAEEEADKLGIEKIIYPPMNLSWSTGFKPRNLAIAGKSDIVFCIVVETLPEHYSGMRFETCYHCAKSPLGCKSHHIKSGGCWTAIRARKRDWVIIS